MNKKYRIYIIFTILLFGLIGYRTNSLIAESRREVFNQNRIIAEYGLPVDYIILNKKTDVLKEPLSVKNNRALVSINRISRFGVGDKVEGGKIVSVSNKIDLDTGMYIIRTTGVKNGDWFSESRHKGFFVPLYAISNNTVFIATDGIASPVKIEIKNRDSKNALIAGVINDGDILIVSKVESGQKIKLQSKDK